MSRAQEVQHPHIRRVKGVCGGEPVIRGTRISVRSIVESVHFQGMTPEEMVREWRQLSLAKIYDALSYYHDHKEEIDRSIQENREGVARRSGSR